MLIINRSILPTILASSRHVACSVTKRPDFGHGGGAAFTSGTDGKGEQAMVIALARLFRSRQWNRGFTLIELLIVILIVGILAAVATPLYLGYIKDAKTAEAKAVAGSLWTAVQSNAIATCDTAVTIASGYPKAGLTATGTTTPARWSVTPVLGSLWRARTAPSRRPDRVHGRRHQQ